MLHTAISLEQYSLDYLKKLTKQKNNNCSLFKMIYFTLPILDLSAKTCSKCIFITSVWQILKVKSPSWELCKNQNSFFFSRMDWNLFSRPHLTSAWKKNMSVVRWEGIIVPVLRHSLFYFGGAPYSYRVEEGARVDDLVYSGTLVYSSTLQQ